MGSGNTVAMSPSEQTAALLRATVEYGWPPHIMLDAMAPSGTSVSGRASILGVACLVRIDVAHLPLQAPEDACSQLQEVQTAVDEAAEPQRRSRSPRSAAAGASGSQEGMID